MNQKSLMVPVEAGHIVMERYGLDCEIKDWSRPEIVPCSQRIASAHAPFEFEIRSGKYRVNIASPVEKFREYSLRVIEAFIAAALKNAPNCRLIVLHPAPHFWNENAGRTCPEVQAVGEYGLMIEGLQRLSRACAQGGMSLALENNRVRWDGIAPDETYDHERHRGKVCECFASAPQEWAEVPAAVNEDNFGLCLDTGHAVTYAQRLPAAARKGVVDLFRILAGDRLWHVHWSDSILETVQGRDDLHLTVGRGTIPRDIHARIWKHPSVKTYLFEHWTHEGDLAFETRYVERL